MIFRKIIELNTSKREELLDITGRVKEIVEASGIKDGLLSLYAHGATAAVMIQENWDASVPLDMISLLQKMAPRGIWLHDRQDGNGDAHLKAGLVGPSENIPVMDGCLGLSTWQGIFFCEFDGPRSKRKVICTVLGGS